MADILDDVFIYVKSQEGEWGTLSIGEILEQGATTYVYKFLMQVFTGEKFDWVKDPERSQWVKIFSELHKQGAIKTKSDFKDLEDKFEKTGLNDVPFVAFGNEELEEKPLAGATVICKNCGNEHRIHYKNKREVGVVVCPKNGGEYLVALKGRLI